MEYSKTGLLLTEQFEGCRLEAYQDVRGIWTIGYGHIFGVNANTPPCTMDQAAAWLAEDIQSAVGSVNRLVKTTLTQSEFDAICDFIFNVGVGNFAGSTMLKLLNKGDYAGAASEFDRWDIAGGNVVAGLLRRREAEREEFNGPGI
jgi:lysozyme